MDGKVFGLGTVRMPKTADVVAARLRTFILARQLEPGSPLPSERDLIEHFKVSRASIREALRILETEGIIEVRRGVHGGVYAAAPSGEHLTRGLATLLAHRQTPLADLLEIRMLLEPEAAAMAARRASREQRLHFLEQTQMAVNSVAEHVEFHARLGELSGNGLMGLFLGAMRDIVAETGVFADAPVAKLELTQRAHIKIAKAIAAGNEAEARRATERDIRGYIDYLRAGQGGTDGPVVPLSEMQQESFAAG